MKRLRGSLASWLVVALLQGSAWAADLQIRSAAGVVAVTTGPYAWELSTTTFDVIHSASVAGKRRLGSGQVTVDALGGTVVFGAPSEVKTGTDWVELRGWAEHDKNLWYVARYQFFAGRPYVRLVLTLTDRHDKSPAAEPWDAHWNDRLLARWRLQLGAPGGTPAMVTQHNSYSYSAPGEPWVELVNATGSPYQWTMKDVDPARFQLAHGAKDGANQVIWHPMFAGPAEVTALISSFTGGIAYRAAKAATYEVVDAAGQTHAVTADQSVGTIKLGTFTLSKKSVVRLKATGGGEELVLAGTVRITPSGGKPFEIKLGARSDGVLFDGPITLAVKDFWQHHPISLIRTQNAVGWEAIKVPEQYTGGMGLTLETMISMDGPPAAVLQALYAAPRRELLPGQFAVDGSLAHNPIAARYDALLKRFLERLPGALESMDNFGWRNWGDYQIGASYDDKKYGPTEDWANLQYDLPTGLLLAWIRDGDPKLWHFAQASVRHLMDLDLVKFQPFGDKLNGLVYRKGEMPRKRSHIGAEPITDQGFAWRSLLLYHHLTGEQWALDLAKQNIDRLVYYAVTRPRFLLDGDRPTGWILRSALAGAEHFRGDPGHDYQAIADGIVGQLLGYYRDNKRLPGMQPVWQGQMLDGLAQYHAKTGRADVAEAIVGHVRHLLTDCTRRRADGGYELMYCYSPGRKDCPEPQWTEADNYLFLWLSSIAYAYRISHDPFFAKWADTLFTYGESKMRDSGELRSWTSVLGFSQLYLELSPLH